MEIGEFTCISRLVDFSIVSLGRGWIFNFRILTTIPMLARSVALVGRYRQRRFLESIKRFWWFVDWIRVGRAVIRTLAILNLAAIAIVDCVGLQQATIIYGALMQRNPVAEVLHRLAMRGFVVQHVVPSAPHSPLNRVVVAKHDSTTHLIVILLMEPEEGETREIRAWEVIEYFLAQRQFKASRTDFVFVSEERSLQIAWGSLDLGCSRTRILEQSPS